MLSSLVGIVVDCRASAVEESLVTKQSKGLLEQLTFNTITIEVLALAGWRSRGRAKREISGCSEIRHEDRG